MEYLFHKRWKICFNCHNHHRVLLMWPTVLAFYRVVITWAPRRFLDITQDLLPFGTLKTCYSNPEILSTCVLHIMKFVICLGFLFVCVFKFFAINILLIFDFWLSFKMVVSVPKKHHSDFLDRGLLLTRKLLN